MADRKSQPIFEAGPLREAQNFFLFLAHTVRQKAFCLSQKVLQTIVYPA